ncbi:MAG TPA: glycosyltransferase, partial [Acidobacteriota bacterium]|nr:glycosyltransferase [Acidobacteriota bacterium]
MPGHLPGRGKARLEAHRQPGRGPAADDRLLPGEARPVKLSVIIPAYNEKDTVLELVRRVRAVALPLEREIVIVDDFST